MTRREAIRIAPLTFAGLVSCSRKESPVATPVTVVQFDDRGGRLGAATLKRVVHSDSEWRQVLTLNQFYVTRRGSTDTPFTGSFYKSHEAGLFRCVCCGNALFSSETKYDSGTGWPSFWAPIAKENLYTKADTSLSMVRIEALCRLCDAHLGHVFDDGPEPTGLRYCMNESSLKFIRA